MISLRVMPFLGNVYFQTDSHFMDKSGIIH